MDTRYIWIIVAVAIIGYLLYRFTKKESKNIKEGPEKTTTSKPDFSASDVKQDLSNEGKEEPSNEEPKEF